jgi:hypothetical protein
MLPVSARRRSKSSRSFVQRPASASRKPRIWSTAHRRRSRKAFPRPTPKPSRSFSRTPERRSRSSSPVKQAGLTAFRLSALLCFFGNGLASPVGWANAMQRANASTTGKAWAGRLRSAVLSASHIAFVRCGPADCFAAGALEDLPSEFGATMTYSYTEKKRIRKSFAKRVSVLDVPYLLATQLESFSAFLQAECPWGSARTRDCRLRSPRFSRSSATVAMRAWSSSASRFPNRLSTSPSASSAA